MVVLGMGDSKGLEGVGRKAPPSPLVTRHSSLIPSSLSLDGVGACRVQVAGDRSCPDPWRPKAQGTLKLAQRSHLQRYAQLSRQLTKQILNYCRNILLLKGVSDGGSELFRVGSVRVDGAS